MANWKFNLLGDFVAIAPDSSVVIFPGKKHQGILSLLLLTRDKRLPREKLLGLLWGARSNEQARASLRGALSDIKRICKPFGESLLDADRSHVYLRETVGVELDIDVLDRWKSGETKPDVSALIELNGENLLSSLVVNNEQEYESWKQAESEKIQSEYCGLLLQVLDETDTKNPVFESIANRLLTLDDTDENAHRALMRFYFDNGNRSRALRQFEVCQKRIREFYDSPVSAETQALFLRFKTGDQAVTDQGQKSLENERMALPPGGALEAALAVRRFQVASNCDLDADKGQFLAKKIAGAASKFKWFRVLPTAQTFHDSVNDSNLGNIPEILKARYVLDGYLSRQGKNYCLAVTLDDVLEMGTIWSYDLMLDDRQLQDPEFVNRKLVGHLELKLRSNEIKHSYQLGREPSTGYETTIKALAKMCEFSSDNYEETEALFARAVEYESGLSWSYSYWALWRIFCLGQNWSETSPDFLDSLDTLAHEARNRDGDDALAYVIAGHYQSFCKRNFEFAKTLVDTATNLNPYSSFVWMLSSATYSYSGEAEEALSQLEKAYDLSPVESHFMFMYDSAACIANLFARKPEFAAKFGIQAVSDSPEFTNGYKQLLVALGHLKKSSDCRFYLDRLLELDPGFNIADFIGSYPIAREEDRDYFRDGLALAGVPAKAGSLPVEHVR